MIPKYAARSDANHTEITAALRRCGWQTYPVRLPADLLIVKPGRPMLLADIKSHRKAKWTAVQRDVQARGGFRRVYFITHNLEAAALADAQLVFKDGTVTTTLPPFAEPA